MDSDRTEITGGVGKNEESELELVLREALAPSYIFVGHLGSGGMGSVYLARDPMLGRSVAVKVLARELASNDEARERFSREAQAIAAVSHPNIISVYSVGTLPDDLPYFVMEYVGGGSLSDRLHGEGPLPIAEARQLIGEVASALHAAHARGIVHRDIKASNVLYDFESGRALVTDFGIAGLAPTADLRPDQRLTQTGAVMGSPKYMSPEQLAGDAVGPESDVYSLGLMAFEILTGEGPFADADTPHGSMIAHLREDPRRLSELRDEVDPELETVVAACLEKRPADRPSATEVARRLGGDHRPLLEWPPPGLEDQHGKIERIVIRSAVLSWLTAAAVMVSMAVGEERWGFALLIGLLALAFAAGGLAGAFGELVEIGWRIFRARRHGYGAVTVIEVEADMRRDTGALIAGAAEYGGLSPRQRARLRIERLVRAVLLATLALLPYPGLLVGMIWLSRVEGGGAGRIFGAISLPTLVVAFAWLLLMNRELRLVDKARKQLRRSREARRAEQRMGDAWGQSFELANRGQPVGTGGRATSVALLSGIGLAAAAMAAVAAILLPPVLISSVIGIMQGPGGRPLPSSLLALTPFLPLARDVALEPTADLSDLEVGERLYVLGAMAPQSWEASPFHRPLPSGASTHDFPGLYDNPFGLTWPAILDTLFVISARGFSNEQRAYLNDVVQHPGLSDYDVLARSEEIDTWGAALSLPLPDTVLDAGFLTVPVGGIRETGWAKAAQAALALEADNVDQAVLHLREVVSVGVLLADGDPSPDLSGLGLRILGWGIPALEAVYTLSGRGEDALALRARLALPDIPEAVPWLANLQSGSVADREWGERRLVSDSTAPRGLRWHYLVRLARQAPCSSVKDVLSGSDQLTPLVERVRPQLVRTEYEEGLIRVVERSLFPQDPEAALRGSSEEFPLPRWLLLFSAGVLGNARITQCAAIY